MEWLLFLAALRSGKSSPDDDSSIAYTAVAVILAVCAIVMIVALAFKLVQ